MFILLNVMENSELKPTFYRLKWGNPLHLLEGLPPYSPTTRGIKNDQVVNSSVSSTFDCVTFISPSAYLLAETWIIVMTLG